MTTSDPNAVQEVDIFQTKVLGKLADIEKALQEMRDADKTLASTLAAHVRQNIDTFQKVQDYIGEQMSYRLFRQGLEETNIQLELEKKKLELDHANRRYADLEAEHTEDEKFRYEAQKQKLEIEALRKNLELIQNVKHSTQEKIATRRNGGTNVNDKIRDTVVLTTVGTLTAASVAGIVAFVLWLVRLYLASGG